MLAPDIETQTKKLEEDLANYPATLEPAQVGEILNVSRRYVDKMLTEGKLPYLVLDDTKLYKQKRVLKANLIAFMIQNIQK